MPIILSILLVLAYQRLEPNARNYPLYFYLGMAYKLVLTHILFVYYLHQEELSDMQRLISELNSLAQYNLESYLSYLHQNLTNSDIIRGRNEHFVAIMSVFSRPFGQNYLHLSYFLSMINFFSAWYFCRIWSSFFKTDIRLAYIAFLAVPSVSIWTSGLMKECLVSSCIYFILASILAKKHYLISILLLYIAYKIKYYYVWLLCFSMIPVVIYPYVKRYIQKPLYLYVSMGIALLVGIEWYFEDWSIIEYAQSLQRWSMKYRSEQAVYYFELKSFVLNFLINYPSVFFQTVFRPFIWQADNLFKLLSALENMLLFGLICISCRKSTIKQFNALHAYKWGILLYVLMGLSLLGFVMPNIGTISRFKVMFLAFCWWFVLCLARRLAGVCSIPKDKVLFIS